MKSFSICLITVVGCITVLSPLVANAATVTVVSENTPMQYIEALQNLSSDDAPTAWTSPSYDLSQDVGKGDLANGNGSGGWQRGLHGVGCGVEGAATPLAEDGSLYSVYTRSTFKVEDPTLIEDLWLELKYSDGYVAWLNGVEVARSATMRDVALSWNAAPTSAHSAASESEVVPLRAYRTHLVNGENTFALAVWKAQDSTEGLQMKPRLCLYESGEEDDSFKFVVTCDSRGEDINWYTYEAINEPIVKEQAAAIIAEGVDLVICPGDVAYFGLQSHLDEWVEHFFDPVRAAGIPVYPCRGNHELMSLNVGTLSWDNVFDGSRELPQNGPSGEKNKTYSVAYKNALFISLDNYAGLNIQKVNQDWLDDQLAANTRPHVFAFGHTAAFMVKHDDCLASNPEERDTFWNSLGAAGARTYFCGHDHFYNHARIQDAQGNWIHQFVVGTGGAGTYGWDGNYGDGARVKPVAHIRQFGYMVVEVKGSKVSMVFKQRQAANQYVACSDVFTYTVPATNRRVLTTEVTPTDAGTVFPGGTEYDEGTQVTVTATPEEGYQFDHWEVDPPQEK